MKKIELNPPRGGSSQPADFLRPHSPHRRVLFIVQPRKAAGRKRIFRFGVQKWAKNWQQRVVLWAFQGNLWVKKSTFCIVGNFLGIPQFWFFFFWHLVRRPDCPGTTDFQGAGLCHVGVWPRVSQRKWVFTKAFAQEGTS